MNVIDAATQLGEAIAASEELKQFRETENAVSSDEKSQTLMQEYKNLQMDMVKAAKAELSKEELEAIRGLLMSKQKELNEYNVTNDYLVGRSAFENLMKSINEILQYYVTGESSCGGSCSGCNS